MGFANKWTHIIVACTVVNETFSRCKLCLQAYNFIDTKDQLSISWGIRMNLKQLKALNESELVFNHSEFSKIMQKVVQLLQCDYNLWIANCWFEPCTDYKVSKKKNLEWDDPVQGMIGLSGSWTIKKGNF